MEEALDYIMNYSFIFLEYCGCISCAVNKQSIRFAKINFCIWSTVENFVTIPLLRHHKMVLKKADFFKELLSLYRQQFPCFVLLGYLVV